MFLLPLTLRILGCAVRDNHTAHACHTVHGDILLDLFCLEDSQSLTSHTFTTTNETIKPPKGSSLLRINASHDTMPKVLSRYAAPLVLLGLCFVALYPRPRIGRSTGTGLGLNQTWSTRISKKSPHHQGRPSKQEDSFFPKWQSQEGIKIDHLLAFVFATARKLATTVNSTKTRLRFPETFYVLDREGIWVSFTIRLRTWKMMIKPRVLPTEWLMREGWRAMEQEHTASPQTTMSQWPILSRAVYHGDGIPFLAWYGDYKSCNFHNWGNRSIPLFTPAVPIGCEHGFPMPNYKSFWASKETSEEWQVTMDEYRKAYPWESKIRKAVWRGSLSDDNEGFQSVRWRLCTLATTSNATTMDVGLVSIPSRHDHLNLDWQKVGGKANHIRQVDFQKYMAIIDVDGNSWSSRMGELLCYNSVVLKIEPQFVEYFYRDLAPWEHYIPVKYDLSDLLEKVDYVLDSNNKEHVQHIISRANKWCATHLVKREVGRDFLDILEAYASHLERGDSHWDSTWSRYKQSVYTHEAFDMRRIQ